MFAVAAHSSSSQLGASSSRRASHTGGVLRKQRKADPPVFPPMSPSKLSFAQRLFSPTHHIPVPPEPVIELPESSQPAVDARTMTSSMESSIYFGSIVDYDDDDGLDDFFARRLARELETAIITPPENAVVHRVCQSDIGHGGDYFDPLPASPVSIFSHKRPSVSSEHGAPTWLSSSPSQAVRPPVNRLKSKLRKPNRNSNSHPPSAFPGAGDPAPGLFRRLTSWKRQSSTDVSNPSTTAAESTSSVNDVALSVNASALSLPERASPYQPYSLPQRPCASVVQPPHSDVGHSATVLQSESFSSWASGSVPGHGFDWTSSTHGHAHETPASSVGALSTSIPSPPPPPPLPAKPVLENVLTDLRTQHTSVSHTSLLPPPLPRASPHTRRKPVPPVRDSLTDMGITIGQAFLDLDPPASHSVPVTPELVSEPTPGGSSSVSSSSEQLHTPAEGRAPAPPLPRFRPPLLRLNSSRRWTMPSSQARAMLCAQEIVETEENYRRALGQLLRGETTLPPPAKLTALVPALLASSPRFAASAHGPAPVFVEAAPALEKALVEWCSVVGAFFNPFNAQSISRRGKRDSLFASDTSSSLHSSSESKSGRLLRSRRQSRAVAQLAVERLGLQSNSTGDLLDGKRKKIPTVQDLAIQPTQRAVRYVLLFRELLEHTHGEDREDVQRALDEAVRIARRCDDALVDVAPLRQPGSSQSSSKS